MIDVLSREPWLFTTLLGSLLVLIITVGLGLIRTLRGPTFEDRLTATLLLGTGGVASLLLLALLLSLPALFDVALLLAMLAAVAAAALTRRQVPHD